MGAWDSHVGVLVELDGKVTRHLSTAVVVPVVLHEVVDVVEHEAVPLHVSHGFLEAHIEQHGPVKRLCPCLQAEREREREREGERETKKDKEIK